MLCPLLEHGVMTDTFELPFAPLRYSVPRTRARTRMHTLARMFARFCFHVSLAFCPSCSPDSCC